MLTDAVEGRSSPSAPLEEKPQLSKERVNAALRGLFKAVVVDYRDGELKFRWHAGGESWLLYTFV